MIDTEKFIINLHKEINRRKMRKQRIYNTIYLMGVFVFDFLIVSSSNVSVLFHIIFLLRVRIEYDTIKNPKRA